MQKNSNIRPIIPEDLPALKIAIDANELFPSAMLDEMTSDYFNNSNSNDLWFTYDEEKPIAIAYCGLEKMTEGTWNLFLIAVHPHRQRMGHGTALLRHIEQTLTKRGERLLLVEPSGLDTYEDTRKFYRQCEYQQEARIREFYQAGEDKIVFRKSLID